jgi:hypothetical protein
LFSMLSFADAIAALIKTLCVAAPGLASPATGKFIMGERKTVSVSFDCTSGPEREPTQLQKPPRWPICLVEW